MRSSVQINTEAVLDNIRRLLSALAGDLERPGPLEASQVRRLGAVVRIEKELAKGTEANPIVVENGILMREAHYGQMGAFGRMLEGLRPRLDHPGLGEALTALGDDLVPVAALVTALEAWIPATTYEQHNEPQPGAVQSVSDPSGADDAPAIVPPPVTAGVRTIGTTDPAPPISPTPISPPAAVSPLPTPASGVPLFSEMADKYIAMRMSIGSKGISSLRLYKRTWIELIGDKPVD